MPLDQSFVGRSYPATAAYEVAREKIREFADAIGDTEPVVRDPDAARAAGHPDVVAPPTFLIVVTMRAQQQLVDDPELALDYSRVVHGDQSFTYHRPVHAGDRVTTILHVDGIRAVAGNEMLSVRCEVDTVEGERVATSRSTLVVRGSDNDTDDTGGPDR